jgi:hypothetical protein
VGVISIVRGRRGVSVNGVFFHVNPRDWWIGYYRSDDHHYVCPLPCLVIKWERGGSQPGRR